MNTQEHLNRIKAKCQELLEIWDGKRDHNSIYMASCGKQAEAGWRATIAAIDDTLNVDESLSDDVQKITTEMMLVANGRMVEQILAAWPIELLDA